MVESCERGNESGLLSNGVGNPVTSKGTVNFLRRTLLRRVDYCPEIADTARMVISVVSCLVCGLFLHALSPKFGHRY